MSSPAQPLAPAAEALKLAGNTAFRGKNFDLAIEKYQAAIDVAPDSAVLYSNLSASLLGANRLAESIEASQKAITLDPTWFKPHVRLVGIYEKLGKIKRALDSAQMAVDLAPDPTVKAENEKVLARMLRSYLTVGPDAAYTSNKISDINAEELSPRIGVRAHQLVRQGKATFGPFSEGARIYAAWARIAAVNKIIALPPFQAGLISEAVIATMMSYRGFHQVSRTGPTNQPLLVMQEQVLIEQRLTGAAGPQASPQDVINYYDEARNRKGWSWEKVNAALDLSIAASASVAHLAMYLTKRLGDAVDHWRRCLDIIEAGLKTWSEVPPSQLSRWLAPRMVRSVQCGLIDSMTRYFQQYPVPEVMDTLPDIANMALGVIKSAWDETAAPTTYPTLTDYAAFRVEHLVMAHCNRGFVFSKISQALACGAVFSAPVGGKEVTKIWRSPIYTRLAAMEYLQAAANASADDPERANFLFIAIGLMCHSGHVSIRDIKMFHKLALETLENCRPLYSGEPGEMMEQPAEQVQKLINKLDTLLKSGTATLDSRLHPSPDPDYEKDTTTADIVPTVFAADEDESGWCTPDGRLVENNTIFEENTEEDEEGNIVGWKKVHSEVIPTGNPPDGNLSGGGKGRHKRLRKNGTDDWTEKSYGAYYLKARYLYEQLVKEATDAFAKAVEDDS